MIQNQPHLAQLHRASEIGEGRERFIGLDRNERVTPWSQKEFRKIIQTLKPEALCHYPDSANFCRELGRSVGLPPSHLYATVGSDGAIRMIFHSFIRPGDKIVFPSPSYAMYAVYGQMFQAKCLTLPYENDLSLDLPRLFKLLDQRPRLITIANPDQPTGTALGEDTLLRIIRYAKKGILVVIDEAYYPFYPHSMIRHVRRFTNLIVTRSFSKSGGLAGLRLGFMAAQPPMIDLLQRVRGAFEVNAMALAAGTYLLKHPSMIQDQVRQIEKGRAVLIHAAEALGAECPPCQTNFQLLRFPNVSNTAALVAALRREKYLVKGSFAAPGLKNCIRVTLAGPEVMRPFAAALKKCLGRLR